MTPRDLTNTLTASTIEPSHPLNTDIMNNDDNKIEIHDDDDDNDDDLNEFISEIKIDDEFLKSKGYKIVNKIQNTSQGIYLYTLYIYIYII